MGMPKAADQASRRTGPDRTRQARGATGGSGCPSQTRVANGRTALAAMPNGSATSGRAGGLDLLRAARGGPGAVHPAAPRSADRRDQVQVEAARALHDDGAAAVDRRA